MRWPFLRVTEGGDVALGGRQHASDHRIEMVFFGQGQRKEECAVLIVEFYHDRRSSIRCRRRRCYVSKGPLFRIPLPFAQKFDGEARVISVD